MVDPRVPSKGMLSPTLSPVPYTGTELRDSGYAAAPPCYRIRLASSTPGRAHQQHAGHR